MQAEARRRLERTGRDPDALLSMRAGDYGSVPSDAGAAGAVPVLFRAESPCGGHSAAGGRLSRDVIRRCSDGADRKLGRGGRTAGVRVKVCRLTEGQYQLPGPHPQPRRGFCASENAFHRRPMIRCHGSSRSPSCALCAAHARAGVRFCSIFGGNGKLWIAELPLRRRLAACAVALFGT